MAGLRGLLIALAGGIMRDRLESYRGAKELVRRHRPDYQIVIYVGILCYRSVCGALCDQPGSSGAAGRSGRIAARTNFTPQPATVSLYGIVFLWQV